MSTSLQGIFLLVPKIIEILKVYIDFLITKEWNHREKYGGTDKVCIQKKKC